MWELKYILEFLKEDLIRDSIWGFQALNKQHRLIKQKEHQLEVSWTFHLKLQKVQQICYHAPGAKKALILDKKKIDYLFISAGENVCWLMNIRGKDLPNSPVANCNLILTKNREIYFFSNLNKISEIKKKFINQKIFFYEEDKFFEVLRSIKSGSFCIDGKTCSVFNEEIIKSSFKIKERNDFNVNYHKKVILPTTEEFNKHKEYLKFYLKKNFFN